MADLRSEPLHRLAKKTKSEGSASTLVAIIGTLAFFEFLVKMAETFLSKAKGLPLTSSLGVCNNEFHTSCGRRDLMEFFDDQKNWGMREVKVGRSWKKDELRIKSNSDLHKLWYILLKEKNMLLTMQHEYKLKFKAFPNPERLDKVEESMENLEEVVRERNRAYFELETGETGERPVGEGVNCFGLPYKYKMCQHFIEKKFNTSFRKQWRLYNYTEDHKFVRDFLYKLNEKKNRKHRRWLRNQHDHVCELIKRFPNVDDEALRAEFPEVDIEKARKDPKSRGNRENPY